MAGSFVKCLFNFIRNCQAVLQCGCAGCRAHQQGVGPGGVPPQKPWVLSGSFCLFVFNLLPF